MSGSLCCISTRNHVIFEGEKLAGSNARAAHLFQGRQTPLSARAGRGRTAWTASWHASIARITSPYSPLTPVPYPCSYAAHQLSELVRKRLGRTLYSRPLFSSTRWHSAMYFVTGSMDASGASRRGVYGRMGYAPPTSPMPLRVRQTSQREHDKTVGNKHGNQAEISYAVQRHTGAARGVGSGCQVLRSVDRVRAQVIALRAALEQLRRASRRPPAFHQARLQPYTV